MAILIFLKPEQNHDIYKTEILKQMLKIYLRNKETHQTKI